MRSNIKAGIDLSTAHLFHSMSRRPGSDSVKLPGDTSKAAQSSARWCDFNVIFTVCSSRAEFTSCVNEGLSEELVVAHSRRGFFLQLLVHKLLQPDI